MVLLGCPWTCTQHELHHPLLEDAKSTALRRWPSLCASLQPSHLIPSRPSLTRLSRRALQHSEALRHAPSCLFCELRSRVGMRVMSAGARPPPQVFMQRPSAGYPTH